MSTAGGGGKDNYLIKLCANALDSFKIKDHAVDIFIKEYLTKHEDELNCEDETFIIEVFSGCVYYNKLFRVLIDGFYQSDGKNVMITNYNFFVVISYLVVFRMDEISVKRLKNVVLSQNTSNMNLFFNYLICDLNIKGWVYDRWCEVYEKKFLDEKILTGFDSAKPSLEAVLDAIEEHIRNNISPKFNPKPLVVPEPFDLTVVQPRAVPIPKKIPQHVAMRSKVPLSNRKKPAYELKLRQQKDRNREEVLKRLELANKNLFSCANPELSEKAAQKLEKIRQEEMAKLKFNQSHVQERLKVEEKPIKMNVAAILREGLHYRKKEKESEDYLAGLLRGDFDRTQFDEWQKKQLDEDNRVKLMNTHYNRLQGQLSREQAILSRKQMAEENRKVAEDLKQDIVKKQEDQLVVRIMEEKRIKELIDEVTRSHQAAQEAKVKHTIENQHVVKQVNKESRELMKRALEEEEERMKKRSEMIAQIRALEHLKPDRKQKVDFTATAGHWLFTDMSLAELEERLTTLKEEQLKEQEKKREQIKKEKQEKSKAIFNTIAKISMHRTEACTSSVMRAKRREEEVRAKSRMVESDEKLKQLQRKLELKKMKRVEIEHAEIDRIESNKKLNFRGLIREKKELEKNRWKHLENSHRRMAERGSKMPERC